MARQPGPSRDAEAFPEPETVEFGWNDDRKVSGRRKKLQHKAKPGSFGEPGPAERAEVSKMRAIASWLGTF